MILTACDASFLTEASSLIKSCARHEPDQQFYLFLVNGGSLSDATFERWHPKIKVERVTWALEPGIWRAVMCCARSIPLVTALEEYGEPVLYLDSDTLIRGPLTALWQAIQDCDLMVKHRPTLNHVGAAGTPHASKFNNGVMLIRPSEAGRRFARAYDDKLREYVESGAQASVFDAGLGLEHIVDQELLYLTYLEHRDRLTFTDLPQAFNDATFRGDSVIWHGKGTARQHPLYRLERTRYEHRFLFHPLAVVTRALLQYRGVKKKISILSAK